MREVFNRELSSAILQPEIDRAKARVFKGTTDLPFSVQKMVIDLTTARLETNPLRVGFPFKSFYIQDATDVNCTINFKPITRDSIQSFFEVKQNDVWSCDYPIPEAFLHWDAQSGKTITIVFFVDSEFKSGSQISVTGGGVTLSEGSAVTTSVVALSAATAAEVFTSDTSRKVGYLQNNTGAPIWLGPSTVTNAGATLGLEVQAGDTFTWRSTASLYAYSAAGGNVLAMVGS